MEEMVGAGQLPGRVRTVVQEAARSCGVTVAELLSTTRRTPVVLARGRAVRRLRNMGFSLGQIGRYMNRHHTTILKYLQPRAPGAGGHAHDYEITVPDLSGEWI